MSLVRLSIAIIVAAALMGSCRASGDPASAVAEVEVRPAEPEYCNDRDGCSFMVDATLKNGGTDPVDVAYCELHGLDAQGETVPSADTSIGFVDQPVELLEEQPGATVVQESWMHITYGELRRVVDWETDCRS